MKKLSNIVATIIVALFLLFFGMKSEAMGQCPPGASYVTLNFVVDGCTYAQTICYECPVALGPTWFGLTTTNLISSPCTSTMNLKEVRDSITVQIQNNLSYIIGLCTSAYPPCEESTKTVYLRLYNCGYLFNDMGNVRLEICDYTSYCLEEYEVCWEEPGVGLKHFPPLPLVQVGTPDCDGDYPNEPPDYNQQSDCFTIKTCE